jgi:hypothetical protein
MPPRPSNPFDNIVTTPAVVTSVAVDVFRPTIVLLASVYAVVTVAAAPYWVFVDAKPPKAAALSVAVLPVTDATEYVSPFVRPRPPVKSMSMMRSPTARYGLLANVTTPPVVMERIWPARVGLQAFGPRSVAATPLSETVEVAGGGWGVG